VNVLIDTSVWSLALRRNPKDLNPTEQSQARELAELVKEGRVQLLGLIRQELLSGIKTQAQFEKLRLTLQAFPDVPVATGDHESAARASNDCRSKGITVSLVDSLICAVAMQGNLLIFTTDPDFQTYARVLPLKLHTPRDRP